MTVIKFSHRYNKMPRDFQRSKLLAVLSVKLEDLGADFILYDTAYVDELLRECYYPLPAKGDYMVLLLQAGSGCGQLWTTIRSQKGKKGIDKMAYYKGKVGEVVECRITE